MSEISSNSDSNEKKEDFDLKREFFKYLFFWKYFIISLLFCLTVAFVFNRYSSKIFETNAKIKILDKKDSAIELPSAEDLFSSSKINLENELEVIKSYSILEEVIRNLNLTISVIEIGNVKSSLVKDYPFTITSNIPIDSITEMLFEINFTENRLEIIDEENDGKEYVFKGFSTFGQKHDLPFEISNARNNLIINTSYYISFKSIYEMVIELKEKIIVEPVGKKSDIISLNYNSASPQYSEDILNELIDVFDNDGIVDRQLIHQRTIDFVNDRYNYLSIELDSIEINKQLFKKNNNIIDLVANSAISLQKSSETKESVFFNENQIFVVSSLLDVLAKSNFELLPQNFVVENKDVNLMINTYNEKIIDKIKLISSAGPNNPSIKLIDNSLRNFKSNITFSLKNYLDQLNMLNIILSKQSNEFNNQVSAIPEKEKILRTIERNQEVKEALYLFLLQKREEAEVSFAITEPSIKVVEYAVSNYKQIYPNNKFIFLAAIFLGLLIPFGILYFIFLFDTKINSRDDLKFNDFSLLGEIPFFDFDEKNKLFSNPNSRDLIAESFRILMSNVRYLFKSQTDCNVMLVSSSVKGEGKTLTAMNLSLAFASLNKKVLLIGCDLRNPQLHKHIDEDKNTSGLVNFLIDTRNSWRKSILKKFDNQPTLDILLSGALPPNPLNLINNGNLDILINQAKKEYDYIIIDSAPTLLVADTKSIYHLADTLVYMARCGVTDKDIIAHINSISIENQINLGVVLNGVGERNSYGYSYSYQYGYGYNYKYSYNYGYGYGYEEDKGL